MSRQSPFLHTRTHGQNDEQREGGVERQIDDRVYRGSKEINEPREAHGRRQERSDENLVIAGND